MAQIGSDIAGYIVGCPMFDIPEVDYIDILPPDLTPEEFCIKMTFVSCTQRNQGISKRLKTATIDLAKERRYKRVWSYVAKWNETSIAVNRKLGFQEEEDLGERYKFTYEIQ